MKRPAAISDTLVITRALRRQAPVRAPASLAPAVLRRVGLADLYWKLDSPIGALHVAQAGGIPAPLVARPCATTKVAICSSS